MHIWPPRIHLGGGAAKVAAGTQGCRCRLTWVTGKNVVFKIGLWRTVARKSRGH